MNVFLHPQQKEDFFVVTRKNKISLTVSFSNKAKNATLLIEYFFFSYKTPCHVFIFGSITTKT